MHSCHRLTKREREVLALVAQGKRNRQIAELLTITEGTVEVHLHNIFQKLEVSTRTQAAVAYMFNPGLAQAPVHARGTSLDAEEGSTIELNTHRALVNAMA
jgi:DNA-binding CsgD family transcriptional regulator